MITVSGYKNTETSVSNSLLNYSYSKYVWSWRCHSFFNSHTDLCEILL